MVHKLAKLVFVLLILGAAGSCSNSTRPQPAATEDGSNFVPGEVMVQFIQSISEDEALAIVEEYGLTWRQWLSRRLRVGLIGTPVGEERNWVATLNSDPRVLVAQVNHTGIQLR